MTEDARTPIAPREAARLLRAAGDAIAAELRAMPERLLVWHPGAGEWCAKEVLGHLIEAERRGFAGRIRTVIAGGAIVSWDQAAVARERRDCERDGTKLLDEFLALRADSATLVDALRAGDLERGAQHPTVGWLSVNDVLQEWLHHDRNHLKQIVSALQDFVWPAMGNAQRFSRPD